MSGYYYVSSVIGTRTADTAYSSAQSGTFATLGASNVYASITLAITAGASDDDIICVSDAHDHSTASTMVYTGGTAKPLHIICVDDDACQTFVTSGGSETVTGTSSDFQAKQLLRLSGLTLTVGDWIYPAYSSGSIVIYDSCSINLLNGLNSIVTSVDGAYMEYNDCVVDIYSNSTEFEISNGATMVMNGGSVESTTSGALTNLFTGGFDNGGGHVYLTEVDLSIVTGNIIGNAGSALTTDDAIYVKIDKCTVDSGVTFNNETFVSKQHKILVTNSSSSSSSAEYQYYFHTRGGVVDDNTATTSGAVVRSESTPFELSNTKVSLKCLTDSNAEIAMPFEFEFPTTFVSASVTSSDTIRVFFASLDSLDDSNVWISATYPDSTSNNEFKTVYSVTNPNNPLRTAGSLSVDSTSTWTGDTSHNKYYIDLTLSAGDDSVPLIKVYVVKGSTTNPIFFDTTVDVVS